MQWSAMYGKEKEPTTDQVRDFVGTPLWDNLTAHMQEAYSVRPTLSHSRCSMDNGAWEGWNVKYKKSGKALCTLYPKRGFFVALIAIGAKEAAEADLLIPLCDGYTQDLYHRTKSGAMGKSLAIEVNNENVLNDVKNLVALTWIDVIFTDDFVDSAGVKSVYCKDSIGNVCLNCSFNKTTALSTGYIILQLPVGYRPAKDISFVMSQTSGVSNAPWSTVGFVYPDGKVAVQSGTIPNGFSTALTTGFSVFFPAA